jgi:hypothetical protein
MTALRRMPFVTLVVGAISIGSVTVSAQTRTGVPPTNESLGTTGLVRTNTVVKDAPYSADAITTVTQVLGDGTKIERSVTANIYRNSAGITRREQTVLGLASLTRGADVRRTITITDPVARVTIALDEQARTARRTATPLLAIGPTSRVRVFALPQSQELDDLVGRLWESRGTRTPGQQSPDVGDLIGQLMAQPPGAQGNRSANPPANIAQVGQAGLLLLGARQIEGLSVTGRRTTQIIPPGEVGNDRPIVVTDERWESEALKVVIASRHADPRTGTVDYRLTNITLGEPATDLFVIPSGYTIIDGGTQGPNGGGARGGRSGR